LDANQTRFGAGVLLEISNTATATVEYTFDRPETDPNNTTTAADNWANATWYDITDLTGVTATSSALVDTNVMGVRIDCTAYTSGTVTLTVNQGYQS
jgi:hypothetical protein